MAGGSTEHLRWLPWASCPRPRDPVGTPPGGHSPEATYSRYLTYIGVQLPFDGSLVLPWLSIRLSFSEITLAPRMPPPTRVDFVSPTGRVLVLIHTSMVHLLI